MNSSVIGTATLPNIIGCVPSLWRTQPMCMQHRMPSAVLLNLLKKCLLPRLWSNKPMCTQQRIPSAALLNLLKKRT